LKRGPLQCGGLTRGAGIVPTSLPMGLLLGLAMTVGATTASAQVNCNPGIEFYAEGPLKQCNLNGNHRLYTARGDVVVCADGYSLVQFADGRLQSCTVTHTQTILSERCEAPARLELAADGSLRGCHKIKS